jgi:hypothetical protein
MRRVASFLLACGVVIGLLIGFERPAYAYVDPGSGLFLVQGIGTFVAGVFFYIRRRLKLLTGDRTDSVSSSHSD